MQEKRFDGSFGHVMDFNSTELKKSLKKESVESVEVFNATDEEIQHHNKYKVGKRFQKAPRVKRKKS